MKSTRFRLWSLLAASSLIAGTSTIACGGGDEGETGSGGSGGSGNVDGGGTGGTAGSTTGGTGGTTTGGTGGTTTGGTGGTATGGTAGSAGSGTGGTAGTAGSGTGGTAGTAGSGTGGTAGSGTGGTAGSAGSGTGGTAGSGTGGTGGTGVDPCNPDPCDHGTCSAQGSGYSCACDPGYSGTNCDVDINECGANPCQNGGTCTDAVNGYSCACAPGFSGTNCETNTDDCSPNPCQNGGTCTDGVNSHSCACPQGYGGNDCEIVINGCSPNPCANGGTCTNNQGNPVCACAAGYSGPLCATNIDDCSPNPCQNGGTCTDGVNSHTCTCAPGYSGANCATNINDCSPNPCQNGGTCTDGVNSHTCTCAPGYSGADCATNINDCSPNPCQNGGTCTDGVNSHTCACVGGYTGANCQTPPAITCGNGVIEGTEQCDDGDTDNLDGCNSGCKYEVVARMTDVDIVGGNAPAFCANTNNALGRVALTSTALGQLNPPLQQGIADGTTNILIQALGLDDLTGNNDTALTLGVLTGFLDPAKGTWPGNNPIDWWFLADAATVDGPGIPTGILSNGVLTNRILTAGPSSVTLSLNLAGSPSLLQMRNAKVAATINNSPAPNVPAPPPAALAAGLTVFQTITATSNTQGLCGAITVASLAQIPVPEVLTTGTTACSATCTGSKAYTYCGANNPVGAGCNSLLDVLVGGCKVVAPLCIAAVNATQPDTAGTDGDIDALSLGAGNKVSTSSTNNNTDGYSAYLRFTANRAHLTGRQ